MKAVHAAMTLALLALGAAQAKDGDSGGRPWQLELGLGVSHEPNYSGANESSPRLLLWANGECRTERWGVYALDSGSLTLAPQLRWTVGDDKNYGVGLLFGHRTGRSESNPGLIADGGSDRLKGMGSVSAAVDGGVQGWVAVLGVPVFAQLRTALSSDQGTIGVLGIYMPLELARDFTLTVLPSVTWANDKEMQTFYGVTPAQSAASRFSAYSAGAGWKNAALEINGDWKIAGSWHLLGGVAYQRLLGNAADSPLVQHKNQWSGLISLSYRF